MSVWEDNSLSRQPEKTISICTGEVEVSSFLFTLVKFACRFFLVSVVMCSSVEFFVFLDEI